MYNIMRKLPDGRRECLKTETSLRAARTFIQNNADKTIYLQFQGGALSDAKRDYSRQKYRRNLVAV